MTTNYQRKIAHILQAYNMSHDGISPRIIEAWMREAVGTLDGLTSSQFAHEVGAARDLALVAGAALNDDLARSYGL